jgi:predicted nucleic acid-binding protein
MSDDGRSRTSGDGRPQTSDGERTLLVDASVVIRLTEIGELSLLDGIDGRVVVPQSVEREVNDDPAATRLSEIVDGDDWGALADAPDDQSLSTAGVHLGKERVDSDGDGGVEGDVALLAHAMETSGETVVVSDDRPLRETCKALSVPVSGSLGVLIRAVECDELGAETARDRLYAMDEVGARLSASLIRRAERLIDEASE